MISSIILDLDGTLLPPIGGITQRSKRIIQKANIMGISIILCSGRRFGSVKPYADFLEIDCPIIAYSGSWIQHSKEDKPIFTYDISWQSTLRLLDEISFDAEMLGVYIDDLLYLDNENEYSKRYENHISLRSVLVPSLNNFLKETQKNPTKLLITLANPEKLEIMYNKLQQKFAYELDFVRSWETFLEVGKIGISKGSALIHFSKLEGIDLKRAVIFGDQENDIAGFRVCGLSVAMGNAPASVKSHAKYVAPTNGEDGVAQVLEKMLECA